MVEVLAMQEQLSAQLRVHPFRYPLLASNPMTQNDKVIIALTTCPSEHEASKLAGTLIAERLVACVNRIPIRSTYLWNNVVQSTAEVQLVMKTTEARFDELKTRIKQLHTYELPELVAIPVCAGAETYLDWVRDNVK